MARDTQTHATQLHAATAPASSGSQTILETRADGPATLRLRGAHETDQRRIQWAEDVIDNEGMGRKSSKVCCIYHKPGADDSDSSESSSESDDEPDLSRAQRSGDGKRRGQKSQGGDKSKGKARRPSPNAYERQPKHKHGQNG
ncbi:hypothetical protein AMS68_003583 [Peltaster fructicola]|uniref:Type 1 phosphatases regulator n=1 Tax=Peltaster fructicola TaxID=286661 RepID=A0A6H0XTR6_9PEZI|nr:hypothetical protein AMS68_003583 [Peltaster fructicola]